MAQLTGTITSSGTSVTGTSTLFREEIRVNDKIKAGSVVAVVVSIASNTSMVVSVDLGASGAVFYKVSEYFGDPFETADMTGTTKSIRFKPNDYTILRAMRTWLIFNNYSGSFTGLSCKLYSDRSTAPGALIATSTNTFAKADITAQTTAVREIYFLFSDISLHPDTYYHLVLNCSSYTYAENSHVAWRKQLDPVYRTGWTQSLENLAIAPYSLTLIGADL